MIGSFHFFFPVSLNNNLDRGICFQASYLCLAAKRNEAAVNVSCWHISLSLRLANAAPDCNFNDDDKLRFDVI